MPYLTKLIGRARFEYTLSTDTMDAETAEVYRLGEKRISCCGRDETYVTKPAGSMAAFLASTLQQRRTL